MPTRKGWVTPESIPGGTVCRQLIIPDDDLLYAAVKGALVALTFPDNWEQVGAATPEECAAAMQSMYDDFVAQECESMVVEVDHFSHEVASGVSGGGIVANTDTDIPFNTDGPWNAGNVTRTGNSFALSPGLYLIQMEHVFFSNTGDRRVWLHSAINPSTPDEGSVMQDGAQQTLFFHKQIRRNFSDTLTFRARSTVSRANDAFGLPYPLTARSECYGEVSFIRLGD